MLEIKRHLFSSLDRPGSVQYLKDIAHSLVALTHAGGPEKAGNETASIEFSTEHASMERLDDDFPDFHLSLGAASHIAEQLCREAR